LNDHCQEHSDLDLYDFVWKLAAIFFSSCMLDISFIISCVWLQSINRGFTPHSCIIYNTIYPFHNPTSSRSIPRNSTGYEPGFAHSFSNTFILQLQLHPQRFSWFPRLPFAPRVLRSIFSFKRKLPCFNSFLSITVDKSCRHRMHLFHENYFISSFLHSLVLSLFPISVDEIASLLPCFLASMPQREKVVRTHKKLLLYLAFKSLYNKWRRMGTDHSRQAPQIWYIRSNISVVEGMMIFQD